ncbi:MAG: tandem-95 repeat protein [Planctomycetales bacterium]|nr:tandem-95 repeat protein [Planctomycetales bacterium]
MGDYFVLEDRVLFNAVSMDAIDPDDVPQLSEEDLSSINSLGFDIWDLADVAHEEVFVSLPAEEPQARALIVVDGRVDDLASLLDGVDVGSSEVIVIDENSDAIALINEALDRLGEVDSIHIVSHGKDGGILLGETWLSANNAVDWSGIAQWSQHLSADADILIYGCDVASGEAGTELLNALSVVTGADVAASDDATGHESLGGDWDLEYEVGTIDSAVAVPQDVIFSWYGTLDITSNLVAYYEFEEGSGIIAGDSTANNNDGTLLDSPIWTTGIVGTGALDFSGDFDRMEAADRTDLDFSGDFSVSFWFNSTQTPTSAARLVGQSDGGTGFVFYTDSFGDVNWFINGSGGSTTFWTTAPLDGDWHLVTGVRSGNDFELFIDGASAATTTATVGTVSSTDVLRFGSSTPSSADYDGKLDDVRIYDRALSTPDVGELYALGSNTAPVITSNGGGSTAAVSVSENTTSVTTVTATDAELDTLTYSITGGVDAAKFSIDASTGELAFVTAPDFESPVDANTDNVYEVTVQVSDGSLADSQAISITVTNVGTGLAVDDTFSGAEDTTIVGNVLGNDPPADGGTFSAALASDVSNGSLSLNPDGSFNYTPAGNWSGTDSFEYVAVDTSTGPVHYWGLEGDGTDAVGTADGTLMNGPTTVSGFDGNTLQFDGVDDYVQLTDVSYSSDFTLSFYFKVDDITGAGLQYFYSHGTVGTTNVVHVSIAEDAYPTVGYRNNLITTILDSNDSVSATGQIYIDVASLVGDGQWHFYTATVSSISGTRVYIDGALQGSDTTGTAGVNPVGNAVIGGRSDLDPSRLLGPANRIDSVAIYDRALSVAEIASLSNDSLQGTVTINVNSVNDAPVLSSIEGARLAYTENDGAVALTSTLAVTDVDDTNIESAVVAITANYASGEDTLSFTNQNGITGSWNSGTGTLSLTGTATKAQYEAAIRSITYTNSSENPTTTTRTISFTVNDGDINSNTPTRDIAISSVNDDPANTSGLPTDVTVTEDVSTSIDLSALEFSDVDAAAGSLTVTLTTSTGGNLTAAAGAGITIGGTSNALTISGNLTDLNNYFNNASNITYLHGVSNTNGNDADTIQVEINDNGNTGAGGGADINLGTVNVDITAINDNPTNVGSLPTDVTVTEDVATNVDLSAVDFSDVDAGSSSLTVTLSTSTGGQLTTAAGTGITLGGTATARTLTGTLTDLNAYLNDSTKIQYLHATANLNGNDADTITVTINDNGNTGSGGGTDQTLGVVNVDITAVNDEQVLATNTGTTVAEGSTGNVVTTAMLETTDVDNSSAQLIYTVDAVPANGTLYNNGVALSATDTFTQADIDANLITYDHDGSQTASDSFDFTVDDGSGSTTSATFSWTVTNVNDAPVLASIEDANLAYTENDGAVAITSTLAVTDVDDTNIESAVVAITANYVSGEDTLSFTDQNGISGSWNVGTGTLTLTGTATKAQYEAAIRSITYTNTSENPTTSTRTISFTINDGDVDSNTTTRDITISSVNDDPTNAGSLPTDISVTEDASTGIDLSAIDLSDVDVGPGSLTVTLTTSAGGDLSAAAGVGITIGGSSTALTISGNLTDLNNYFDNASNISYLHGVAHTNGNNADTIQVEVNDNGNTGVGGGTNINLGTVNVGITAINDNPTNAGSLPTDVSVTEDVATNVDLSAVDFSDVDAASGNLTVTLTTSTGGDLSAAAGAGITIGGSSTALTISGSLTDLNNYFDNTSNISYLHSTANLNGNDADTIAVTINDNGNTGVGGGTNINLGTVNVDITAVNDAPVLQNNLPITLAEGATASIGVGSLSVSDVDNVATSLTYSVTSVPANGQLELTTAPGLAISSFTQDDIDNNRVVYVHDGSSTTSDSFDFTVSDGSGGTIATNTFNINVTPVDNDAPVLAVNAGSSMSEGATDTIVVTELQFTDTEQPTTSITYTVIATPTNGQLELTTAPGVAVAIFTQDDIDNGRVVYVHDGGETTTDSFSFDVDDGAGNVSSGHTFALAITPVNDSPVVAVNTGITVAEGGTVVISSFELDVTDPDDSGVGLPYTVTSPPTEGQLEFVSNPGVAVTTFTQNDLDTNQLVYVHDGGEGHVDSFSFQVKDGGEDGALGDTGTFAITVTPVNDNPVASDDTFTVNENSSISGNVTASDVDVDGDPLTATLLTPPANGTLVLNANGSFTYTPDADYDGPDSFQYQIDDGNGATDTATVTIVVNNTNTPPVAHADFVAAVSSLETVINGLLLGNDLDPDGDSFSIIITSQPLHGTIQVRPDGSVVYKPTIGYLGADSFTYALTDGTSVSQPVQVTIDVTAAGQLPAGSVPFDPNLNDNDNNDSDSDADSDKDTTTLDLSLQDGQDGQLRFVRRVNRNGQVAGLASVDDGDQFVVELANALLEADPNLSDGLKLINIQKSGSVDARDDMNDVQSGVNFKAVAIDTQAMLRYFDKNLEEIQQSEVAQKLIVQSAKVLTTGFSVGYILWTIRGGYLMAVLSSSLPVWSQFDPVPVLAGWNSTKINDDEDAIIGSIM